MKFKSFVVSGIKFRKSLVTAQCRISFTVHRDLNLTAFIFGMGNM